MEFLTDLTVTHGRYCLAIDAIPLSLPITRMRITPPEATKSKIFKNSKTTLVDLETESDSADPVNLIATVENITNIG